MGSSPKPPEAPDPVVVAKAQADANIATARNEATLNRYNQTTPFGSSVWSQDAENPDKWANTFQLDPQIQGMLGNYYAASGKPIQQVDFSSLPQAGSFDPSTLPQGARGPRMNNLPTAGSLDLSGVPERAQGLSPVGLPKIGGLSSSGMGPVGTGASYRAAADQGLTDNTALVQQGQGVAMGAGGLAGSQIGRLQNLYGTEFNYDSAPAMPEANETARQRIEDAYYKSQSARLDPRFRQEENEYRSRLANQGITEGSEAYNREMTNFGMTKNDAYSQATNSAITNSTSEMQKLFGMGLAARQQGVGEANELRALPTREAQAAMGLYGNASAINTGNLAAEAAQRETAQRIAASAAGMDMGIRGQQFGERQAVNDAQMRENAQMFGQRAAVNESDRTNRESAVSEALATGEFQQSLRDAQMRENFALDDAAGRRRSNALNEGAQLTDMQNRARATALQEQLTSRDMNIADRNQLLNELMALTSGSQLQGQGGSAVSIGQTPVAQSIYNTYQGQMGQYNADVGSQNTKIGAGMSAAAMAAIYFL